MAFDRKIFSTAQNRLAERRANNKLIEEKRRAEVYAKLPEYADLAEEISGTISRVVRLLTANDFNAADKVDAELKKNEEIQRKMTEILTGGGFPADYLNRVYTCPKCKDEGTVNGEWCDCFKKILTKIAAEDLNAHSPLKLCSFDTFRSDAYPDEIDEEFGISKRAIMEKNLGECVQFAREFEGKGCGLFMIGCTGLGKTHLSLAVANEVIKRGFNVVYGSAPELLRKIQREQFSKTAGDDTMMLITDCDLLILDDLGAENTSEYTTSLLYEIINSRQSRSLPMIINTNLDEDGLKQRYQDRLWSRLFSMRVMYFRGYDNRLRFLANINA